MRGGPTLALEFSRVSAKRKMGLAVCIDEAHGAPCVTHAILSVRATAEAARDDLAARERAPRDLIGAVSLSEGRAEGRTAARIADWCRAQGLDGAVWTDLRPNFEEHAGVPFDHDAAEAWLLGLTGESRDEAVRYIRDAPPETDTPLRRRLDARAWWQAELARLAAPEVTRRSAPRRPPSTPPSRP